MASIFLLFIWETMNTTFKTVKEKQDSQAYQMEQIFPEYKPQKGTLPE